jgi:hypothetical protein
MLRRSLILLVTVVVILPLCIGSEPMPMNFYTTNFDKSENPISEKGHWKNGKADGIDWYDVQTTPGKAFGTQTEGKYTDPTAILTGNWDPNQMVTAKVFCKNPNSKYYQEVEIRLRSSITANSCTGYEVFWRCLTDKDAYTTVARWNGAVRDFNYIGGRGGAGYGVADGDTVSASIIGDVISVYRNGSLLFTVKDSTYKTGNPGMGFNFEVGDTYADFGFTQFTAKAAGTAE